MDCKDKLFSGFYDKDKTPIYDGDIVRFYFDAQLGHGDNSDEYTEMIDICWFDKEDDKFYLMSDIGLGAFVFWHNAHCQVIGNIYKNKELLKDFKLNTLRMMYPDLEF
jgi:uncharacterized phage protein (TIGR01671 family)